MTGNVSSKKVRQKPLLKSQQRWKLMAAWGAQVLDEKTGKFVYVKTRPHAEAFYRGIANYYPLGQPIPTDSLPHQALVWLLQGHYFYDEMCPLGIDYFITHRNCDIGYKGKARGFSVISTGGNNFPREFSFSKALDGVETSRKKQVRIAFRHAIEDQVSYWNEQNYRDVLYCPVTGVLLQRGDIRIDHDPEFVQLVNNFVGGLDRNVEDIEIEELLIGTTRQLHLKEPVRELWRQFHWRFARLQFVSRAGHLELDRQRRLTKKLGLEDIRSE